MTFPGTVWLLMVLGYNFCKTNGILCVLFILYRVALKHNTQGISNSNCFNLTVSYLSTMLCLLHNLHPWSAHNISVLLLTECAFVLKYVGWKGSCFTASVNPPFHYHLPDVSIFLFKFCILFDIFKLMFSQHIYSLFVSQLGNPRFLFMAWRITFLKWKICTTLWHY